MTLILVKNKNVLDILSLGAYVLKSIYEPEKFTNQERDIMMASLINWTEHMKYRKEIGFNAQDLENQISLEWLAVMLQKDKDGEFDHRKESFRLKGIDYKKFHQMPGAHTKEDFIKAKHYHSLLPKEEQ